MQDYRDGVYQTLTRAYSQDSNNPLAFPNPREFSTLVPADKDRIIANMVAGQASLEQIDGDTLSPDPTLMRAPSPFRAKAQAWIHRNMSSRNPNLALFRPLGLGAQWNQELMDLNGKLWNRLDPASFDQIFPKAHGPRVQVWFHEEHALTNDEDQYFRLASWNEIPPPGGDYNEAWWNTWVVDGDEAAPNLDDDWQTQQLRMTRLFASIVDWYRERRLYNVDSATLGGELGGGDTDDVELASGAARSFVTRLEDSEDETSNFALGMIDFVLRGPGTNVHPVDAYWYEPTEPVVPDVEHASETSALPLNYLLAARIGDPLLIDLAMRSTRNIDEEDNTTGQVPPGNESWTTTFMGAPGSRVFKSWKFDAFRVGDPALPINRFCGTYTAKALLATYNLYTYSRNPKAEQYLAELGQVWHDAACEEGPTIGSGATGFKPKGVLPAGFDYVTGSMGWPVDNPAWYRAPDPAAGGPSSFTDGIFSMLAIAAEVEADPVRRTQMYDTIFASFEYLLTLIPYDGPGSPPTGSDGWILNRITNTTARNARRMQSVYEELNAAGSNYDLTILEQVIDRSTEEYVKILAAPSADMGTPKVLTALASDYKQGADLWYHLWPMATEYVALTDSVSNHGPALLGVQAAASGAPLSDLPSNPVSWYDDSPTGSLDMEDIAIVVTEFHSNPSNQGGLAVRALLTADVSGTAQIGVNLLRRLPAGEYRVEIGPDANDDQLIDGTPTLYPAQGPVKVDRGPVQIGGIVLLAGETMVCEVVRVGNITTSPLASLDLAIIPESVSVVAQSNVAFFDVVNLGNRDYELGLVGYDTRMWVVNETTGSLIGVMGLPALQAPVNLSILPVSAQISLFPAPSANDQLRFYLDSHPDLPDVTKQNETVKVRVQ